MSKCFSDVLEYSAHFTISEPPREVPPSSGRRAVLMSHARSLLPLRLSLSFSIVSFDACALFRVLSLFSIVLTTTMSTFDFTGVGFGHVSFDNCVRLYA